MEARLGHDFSDVRVHTGDAADASARSVNAHAYTVGSNIVFQRDKYDPGSDVRPDPARPRAHPRRPAAQRPGGRHAGGRRGLGQRPVGPVRGRGGRQRRAGDEPARPGGPGAGAPRRRLRRSSRHPIRALARRPAARARRRRRRGRPRTTPSLGPVQRRKRKRKRGAGLTSWPLDPVSPAMTVARETRRGSVAARRASKRAVGGQAGRGPRWAPRRPSRCSGGGQLSGERAARGQAGGRPATAVADIDGALREVRGDEPNVAIVEKGLKATKAAGVPVDLEGRPTSHPPPRSPWSRPGFGPAAVAPKKPVPPPKPAKPVSPLGKAGAKAPKPAAGARGAGGQGSGRRWWRRRRGARRLRHRCPRTSCSSRPCATARRAPGGGPGVRAGQGQRQGLRQGQAGASAGRVEGEGGAGRRASTDRRRRRPGQGREGRHDGRPAGRAPSTSRRSSRR